MITVEQLKEDPELKKVFRFYSKNLFLTLNGSLQLYSSLTQGIEDDEGRKKAWDEFNDKFTENIVQATIDMFNKYQLGLAEVCHLVLKLLEISGSKVEEIEVGRQEEVIWDGSPVQAKQDSPIMGWEVKVPWR